MKRALLGSLIVCMSFAVFGQKTVVVNAGEIAPLSFLDNGKPAGIAVDILSAVAKEGKYVFEFKFVPWVRAQNETQESTAAGIVPLTRTAEREPKYYWVAELFQQNLIFVTTGKTLAPKTMAEVAKLKVGLLRGNQAEQALPAAGVTVDAASSEDQNALKLKAGRVDAWLASEFVIPRLWKEAGYDPKELNFGLRYGEPAKIYFAGGLGFSKQDADAIGAAVAKLRKDGTIDSILAKYRQ